MKNYLFILYAIRCSFFVSLSNHMNWNNKKATVGFKSWNSLVSSPDSSLRNAAGLHMDNDRPCWVPCQSRCTNVYPMSLKMYHIQVDEIMLHRSCVGTTCTE